MAVPVLQYPILSIVTIYFKVCLELGGVGNCLFVLLTGYFMVNSKITFAKTLRLWLQVLFYSIFGCIIYMGISNEYRLSLVYYALFPVTNNVYWFFTTYILIFYVYR